MLHTLGTYHTIILCISSSKILQGINTSRMCHECIIDTTLKPNLFYSQYQDGFVSTHYLNKPFNPSTICLCNRYKNGESHQQSLKWKSSGGLLDKKSSQIYLLD